MQDRKVLLLEQLRLEICPQPVSRLSNSGWSSPHRRSREVYLLLHSQTKQGRRACREPLESLSSSGLRTFHRKDELQSEPLAEAARAKSQPRGCLHSA